MHLSLEYEEFDLYNLDKESFKRFYLYLRKEGLLVLNKIRQRSIFLIIIIALALFSFIIGDIFTNMGSSEKSQNVVATINGEDIDREQKSMTGQSPRRRVSNSIFYKL